MKRAGVRRRFMKRSRTVKRDRKLRHFLYRRFIHRAELVTARPSYKARVISYPHGIVIYRFNQLVVRLSLRRIPTGRPFLLYEQSQFVAFFIEIVALRHTAAPRAQKLKVLLLCEGEKAVVTLGVEPQKRIEGTPVCTLYKYLFAVDGKLPVVVFLYVQSLDRQHLYFPDTDGVFVVVNRAVAEQSTDFYIVKELLAVTARPPKAGVVYFYGVIKIFALFPGKTRREILTLTFKVMRLNRDFYFTVNTRFGF